jgi:hypothetical protein
MIMAPIPEASIAEKITDTARRIFTKKEFLAISLFPFGSSKL